MPESAAPATATASDPGPVYQTTGWRVPLLWLLSWVLRAWNRTLRFEFDRGGVAVARGRPAPFTIMLWHNRLFVVPWMVRHLWPGRRIHALVSASRDGAVLTRFFRYCGLGIVRGSSSRFGREALQALIAVQRAGGDIAITPDGPRGPIYQLKAGAVLAARRTRSPVMLLGIDYRSAWRARSWDAFRVPLPFSRVTVRMEIVEPSSVPGGLDGVETLRCRLLELSGETPEAWPRLAPDDDEPATAAREEGSET